MPEPKLSFTYLVDVYENDGTLVNSIRIVPPFTVGENGEIFSSSGANYLETEINPFYGYSKTINGTAPDYAIGDTITASDFVDNELALYAITEPPQQKFVNKVVYNDTTLIDLTSDTVTPEQLAEGVTAHNAKGEAIVGTMTSGGGSIGTDHIVTVICKCDVHGLNLSKTYTYTTGSLVHLNRIDIWADIIYGTEFEGAQAYEPTCSLVFGRSDVGFNPEWVEILNVISYSRNGTRQSETLDDNLQYVTAKISDYFVGAVFIMPDSDITLTIDASDLM